MENNNGGKTKSKQTLFTVLAGTQQGPAGESGNSPDPKPNFEYEYDRGELSTGSKPEEIRGAKQAEAPAEKPEAAAKAPVPAEEKANAGSGEKSKKAKIGPGAAPAPRKKNGKKGTKKAYAEPADKNADNSKNKNEDKSANKKADNKKHGKKDKNSVEHRHGAKHSRGKEEDGLDTSSIAVARGISHEARRRKQNLHDLLRLLIVLAVIALIVGGSIYAYRATTVKSITVTGSQKYSQAQLLNMSRIRSGRNILFYNEKKLAEDMSSIPDIRTVSVTKKFPNNIEIVVSDIVPCAAIEASDGSYAIISEDGYVLSMGESDPGDMPVIRGMFGEGITPATYIDKQNPTIRTTGAVKLLRAIKSSAISDKVLAIDLSSSVYVTLELEGDYIIVLGSVTTADSCIATAAQAYTKFLPVYPDGGTINVFYGKTQVDFTPNK